MNRFRFVWGVSYALRIRGKKGKRSSFTGPVGVHYVLWGYNDFSVVADILSGRPLFFRTRKQAREFVKEYRDSTSCQLRYKIAKYKLSWEEIS